MPNSPLLSILKPAPLEQLRTLASEHELQQVEQLCERRQKETLAWHAAARELLGYDAEFSHTPSGAPQIISDSRHISVSHSRSFVAVIISEHRCAIDIEELGRNFERVSPHFLREEELALCGDDAEFLAAAWCAKETLYKYHRTGGISLLDDITILSYCPQRGQITGRILTNEPITLSIGHVEDNIYTYTDF